jgi:hypothetical protein
MVAFVNNIDYAIISDGNPFGITECCFYGTSAITAKPSYAQCARDSQNGLSIGIHFANNMVTSFGNIKITGFIDGNSIGQIKLRCGGYTTVAGNPRDAITCYGRNGTLGINFAYSMITGLWWPGRHRHHSLDYHSLQW